MLDLALSSRSGRAEGTFNVVNSGAATRFDLAREAVRLAGPDAPVEPIPSPEYPTPAARPRYSALSTARFAATLGRTLRPWKDALKECIARACP